MNLIAGYEQRSDPATAAKIRIYFDWNNVLAVSDDHKAQEAGNISRVSRLHSYSSQIKINVVS